MCRLLLMTGIKNPELAEKFMKEAKVPMSYGNTHGLGYTATKKDGDFFTERWHNNDMLFNRTNVMDVSTSELLKEYKPKLPKGALDVDYSLRGEIDFSQVSSVTMHTRYATCGREFFNTHPFVDGDFSLVHNGVISNAHSLNLNKISTCDSEVALQAYINNNVNTDIGNAQAWLDMLGGYWAFGIFAKDNSGNRILDVIRNDASLFFSEIDGLGRILATTPNIIESSCKTLGLEFTKPYEIESNILFRFDATTGELLSETKLNDSKLNKRWSGYGGMSDEEFESVTGKKKERTAPREFKSRTSYGDGSYKISFKDGSYSLYSRFGTVIEQGVEQEKKMKTDLIVIDGGESSNQSESESPTEDDLPREFKNYEELFTYLYNTQEPLIDRLFEYDAMFLTNHTDQYETIPEIYRSEDWQTEMFDDVLEDINAVYSMFFEGGSVEN